ncbi:MAG: hypothetical protein FWE27_01135 [Defluviitaleaceae bacterium]|nr:hypothetical protein [Defluviitaleaceae bacterium]
MKKSKVFLSLIMALVMVFSFSTTAFANTTRTFSMQAGANGMGAILTPGMVNVDSTFQSFFNVTGVSGTVSAFHVTVGSSTNNTGVMTVNHLGMRNPNSQIERVSWNGAANQRVNFPGFYGNAVNGRYDIWFNCSYVSGYYIGMTLVNQATRSYKNATLSITFS